MGLDHVLFAGPADNSPDAAEKKELIRWRKDNAIHAWFEDHVAGGELDNCVEYDVSREDLVALHEACTQAALAYHAGAVEQAAAILPPRAGFFFGDTALDEWWLESVERTRDEVGRILRGDERPDPTYTYWAWW
jgi:hypothetical protein